MKRLRSCRSFSVCLSVSVVAFGLLACGSEPELRGEDAVGAEARQTTGQAMPSVADESANERGSRNDLESGSDTASEPGEPAGSKDAGASLRLRRCLSGDADPAELSELLLVGPGLVTAVESRLRGRSFAREHIRASDLLGQLPASADAELARLSRVDDAALRRTALAALLSRPDRPAVLEALRAASRDSDPKVRYLAIGSLKAREQRNREGDEALENAVPEPPPSSPDTNSPSPHEASPSPSNRSSNR